MIRNILRLHALTKMPFFVEYLDQAKENLARHFSGIDNIPTLPGDFEAQLHYLLAKAILDNTQPDWSKLRLYLHTADYNLEPSSHPPAKTNNDNIEDMQANGTEVIQGVPTKGHQTEWNRYETIPYEVSTAVVPYALKEAFNLVRLQKLVRSQLMKEFNLLRPELGDRELEEGHVLVSQLVATLTKYEMDSVDLNMMSLDDLKGYIETSSALADGISVEIHSVIAHYARTLVSEFMPKADDPMPLPADAVIETVKVAWDIAQAHFPPPKYGLPPIQWFQCVFDILADGTIDVDRAKSPFVHVNIDPYGLVLRYENDYLKEQLAKANIDHEALMQKDGVFDRLWDLETILRQSPLSFIGLDPWGIIPGSEERAKTKSKEVRDKLLAAVHQSRLLGALYFGQKKADKEVETLLSHIDVHLADFVQGNHVQYVLGNHHYKNIGELVEELSLNDIDIYAEKWNDLKVKLARGRGRPINDTKRGPKQAKPRGRPKKDAINNTSNELRD